MTFDTMPRQPRNSNLPTAASPAASAKNEYDLIDLFSGCGAHFDPSRNGAQRSFLQADGNGYLPGAARWRTVRDAIADLPSPIGTEIRHDTPPLDLHFGRPSDNRNPSDSLLVAA